MSHFLYNLVDASGKIVLERAKRAEVLQYAGLSTKTIMSRYYEQGMLMCRKYKLEIASDAPKREKNIFTPQTYSQWKYVHERYGGRRNE